MRNCVTYIENLLASARKCLWIQTYEEIEVIKQLHNLAIGRFKRNVKVFDITGKMVTYKLTGLEDYEVSSDLLALEEFLDLINKQLDNKDTTLQNSWFVIKDFHTAVDKPNIKRIIRNLYEDQRKGAVHSPLIIISPVVNIPIDLEKLFTVVHYDLPDLEEITDMLSRYYTGYESRNAQAGTVIYTIPSKEEQVNINKALLGLTKNEIKAICDYSSAVYKTINLQSIIENKIQIVQKTGVIDYINPKVTFDDIGGNDYFKKWMEDVCNAMKPEAIEFGCEQPQGYISLGPAGSGKTITAEAIASKFGCPLLIFSPSKIFNKLVGESEQRVEQAFRVVNAIAPCVLLFDEAEKIFGGTTNTESDGGTASRVFSIILRFLAENQNKGIFVIMTSNDASRLPPELTRSGRLDTIWYFDLPSEEDRRKIFEIHLGKTGKTISNNILEEAVKDTEHFTGAEIKNVVKQTMWKAYKRYLVDGNPEITMEDIKSAISNVVPVYRSSREKIHILENYARTRALFANGSNNDKSNSSVPSITPDDEDILKDLEF